jgi:RsiW-degrading membrane proteinase PrsW (M82 family)
MNPVTVGAALVPSALLLWFFHSRDVNREPAGVMWKTFFLGVAAIVPVAVVGMVLVPAVKVLGTGHIYLGGALRAFFVAAIPEEFFKYQVLSRYCMRHKEFDEPMDGMVYGVAASLGFATLENIFYVAGGGLQVAVTRALTAVPGHAMMGAIMGYYAGQALIRPNRSRSFKIAALGWPILLHGLYDAPLMILNNLKHAGSAMRAHSHAGLFILFAAVLLVEIIWALRLVLRLRSEQLKEPKAELGARWLWIWFRIVFGGALTTLAGLMLLYLIGKLMQNGAIGSRPWISAIIVLLTVGIPGLCGVWLFKSGLNGKSKLYMRSRT